MVTAITSSTGCCCSLRHADKGNYKSDFSPLGSSSPTSSSCSRISVLLINDNSRVVQHVVGVSGMIISGAGVNRIRSWGSSCRVRAVLTESPDKQIEQPQRRKQVDGRKTSSLKTPTTSLPTTYPEMGLSESSVESTLEHRLWLGFGTSATLGMIGKAILAAHGLTDVAGIALGAMAAYVLADLGTGVYHWGIDNYGDAKTPVFGSQIDAFQGHHRRPWTITKREFSNNIHAIARPVGYFLFPFLVLPSDPTADTFLGVFLGLVVLSQQFHAWAHSKKSQLPVAVNYLQDHGILISRKMHGVHHRPPYNVNYCIVSGFWNPILNESKFFLRLEAAIYSKWGVAPRNWADAVASEWVQDGSYFEDGSDIKIEANEE